MYKLYIKLPVVVLLWQAYAIIGSFGCVHGAWLSIFVVVFVKNHLTEDLYGCQASTFLTHCRTAEMQYVCVLSECLLASSVIGHYCHRLVKVFFPALATLHRKQ